MRTPIVAANWKMNPPPQGWNDNGSPYRPHSGIDVVVFPSLLDLAACIEAGLATGAQTARPEENGAYTGDVSMTMVAGIGCNYVLCGHSERRINHGETDEDTAAQAQAAITAGLTPIICVGETAQEREAGQEQDVIRRQLDLILPLCSRPAARSPQPVIAYEPIWAIGTNNTATPENAQEMHAFIRSLLEAQSPKPEAVRILYGGSVKPENAPSLIEQTDIDGFLVGAASLDPAAFGTIVSAATGGVS